MKRYLGIDWGKAKIGLALGDDETGMATPLKTVKNIGEIFAVVASEEIDALVIGKPGFFNSQDEKANQHLSESDSPDYKKFIMEIETRSQVTVFLVDEMLTTKQAGALAGDKNTKADEDAIAAMLILQHYLDSPAK